jgi:cytochrome c oxidase subunit 4
MSHTSEPAAHVAQSHAHGHPHVKYGLVFAALCVCTALSWLIDEAGGRGFIDSKRMIAVLVLAIAAAKALFVMMYFMHLKFEGKWKFVLLLPTFILACGLPLALAPDVGLHYYPQQVPQLNAAPAPDLDESHREAPVDSGDFEDEANIH